VKKKKRITRDFVEEYTMQNGRPINIFIEGRLIILASADGHPSSVMDSELFQPAAFSRIYA
jgi:adenosylhomocysteinase